MTNAAPIDADERILRAAGKLFREKGFAATTVRQIAAEADLLPGSLHYRYPSKDEVLVALMERGVRRAIDAVSKAVEHVRDPVERIRHGLRAYLELLCSGDDSLAVMLFDWRSLRPDAREALARERAKIEAYWDGMLYEAHGAGRARPVMDLELVRQFGFGAVNWVATWYRKGGGRTPAQIADAFFNYLAWGLLHESARPADLDQQFAALVTAPDRSTT